MLNMTTQDQSYYEELESMILSWNIKRTTIRTPEQEELIRTFVQTDFTKNPLDTKKAISLKMSLSTLSRLKMRSQEDHIPYQTLINSVMKKWLDGRLVEKN
jgi:predicted DNA binding CopG/RHH family protein